MEMESRGSGREQSNAFALPSTFPAVSVFALIAFST